MTDLEICKKIAEIGGIKTIYELAFGEDAVNKDYTGEEVLNKLREFSDKALHLDTMIDGSIFEDNYGIIFGSGTFLCEHLTKELLTGDDGVCDEFVENNTWQPFEYWSANKLYSEMDSLGVTHKNAVRDLAKGWER